METSEQLNALYFISIHIFQFFLIKALNSNVIQFKPIIKIKNFLNLLNIFMFLIPTVVLTKFHFYHKFSKCFSSNILSNEINFQIKSHSKVND